MTSPYYQYGLELQNNGTRPVFSDRDAQPVCRLASMTSTLTKGMWSHLAIVVERHDRPVLRQRCARQLRQPERHDHGSQQPAEDRSRRRRGAELPGPPRRGAGLQHRADPGPDRDGHEHPGGRCPAAGHDATDGALQPGPRQWSARARSTSPGPPPRIPQACRCTGWSAARGRAAATSPRSGRVRPTPSTTRVSSPGRRTDTEFEHRMGPHPEPERVLEHRLGDDAGRRPTLLRRRRSRLRPRPRGVSERRSTSRARRRTPRTGERCLHRGSAGRSSCSIAGSSTRRTVMGTASSPGRESRAARSSHPITSTPRTSSSRSRRPIPAD